MDFESFDEGVLLKLLVADGDNGAGRERRSPSSARPGRTSPRRWRKPRTQEGRRRGRGARRAGGDACHRAGPACGRAGGRGRAGARARASRRPRRRPRLPLPRLARPRPPPLLRRTAAGGKVLASPLARRLATDLGVDLRSVQGTGPGGRIVERDVKARGRRRPAAAAAGGRRPRQRGHRRSSLRAPTAACPTRWCPNAAPRRAQRRRHAEPAGPDHAAVDHAQDHRPAAGRVEDPGPALLPDRRRRHGQRRWSFREQVKEVHGAKLSVNDLIIKAARPGAAPGAGGNASFTDEAHHPPRRVDIGMAVAIEDGLVTPVIRDADLKTLGQIAGESHELAARARDRKLKPDEMTGATFTVSNLGMMGIRTFSAIINPPEGAILAVGAVRKEPVVKNDQIVIGQRMTLTLSCDHRVIDGALGAQLLAAIVAILERPITLAF